MNLDKANEFKALAQGLCAVGAYGSLAAAICQSLRAVRTERLANTPSRRPLSLCDTQAEQTQRAVVRR